MAGRVPKPGRAAYVRQSVIDTSKGRHVYIREPETKDASARTTLPRIGECNLLPGDQVVLLREEEYRPVGVRRRFFVTVDTRDGKSAVYAALLALAKRNAHWRARIGEHNRLHPGAKVAPCGVMKFTPQSKCKGEWFGKPLPSNGPDPKPADVREPLEEAQKRLRGLGFRRYVVSVWIAGGECPYGFDYEIRYALSQAHASVRLAMADVPPPGSGTDAHMQEAHPYRKPLNTQRRKQVPAAIRGIEARGTFVKVSEQRKQEARLARRRRERGLDA